MGRLKEYWAKSLEDGAENIANILGITTEELVRLNYTIEVDASKEGLIHGYRIEFTDDCPEDILERVHNLEYGCRVHLTPSQLEFDEYNYDEQLEAVSENSSPLENYKDEIKNLRKLIEIEIEFSTQVILYRQVFISVIGLMETFLSDTFINRTLNVNYYFRRFIQSHPEFCKRKFELREIFEESENLKDTAKKIMLDVIYHNLPAVKRMYCDTFDINFPSIATMNIFVQDRHDLVHRNGKRKDGTHLHININLLTELIAETTIFVEAIAKAIQEYDDRPF